MTFSAFLSDHGISTLRVEHRVSQGKGSGLFASTDLLPGTEVVSVPTTALLGSAAANQIAARVAASGLCINSDKERSERSERAAIVSALLVLRFGGGVGVGVGTSGGFNGFAEYAAELPPPESLDSPVFFNVKERALLVGTGLDVATDAKLGALQREYFALRDDLMRFDPLYSEAMHLDEDEELPLLNFEAFLWADAIFWSRVISFKSAATDNTSDEKAPDYHMVPFIDFANHSETPEMAWRLTPSGISLVITSETTVKKGSELHISYGSKPNAELLFIHGFTIPNNKNDSIAFQPQIMEAFGETEEEFLILQQKKELIQSLSLPSQLLLLPANTSLAPQSSSTSSANPISQILSKFQHIISKDSLLLLLISVTSPSDIPTTNFLTITSSSDALWDIYLSSQLFPILLLRATSVLLSQVQERAAELSQSEPEEETNEDDKDEEEEGEEVNPQRLYFINILREGHYEILGAALDVLEGLQKEYAEMDVVVRYLAEMSVE
ncbi:SET domain-containing protein [Rhizoclosmatium globosum]|uniref:SET domain-containing protein n=1 Tax=Rhizoclosmatium globosum TaxID=329046 RepID=A0A1Y2BMF5_9FUNG|nr:SET domain-containing protein [Rhizoclosmatium globosum]ORY35941.1 SET domain-containing protein [Rhizoclosmatium globosum]|eukprot:ORY32759.1 SET domain-containing protein [Rhizoclosmatium globosum]